MGVFDYIGRTEVEKEFAQANRWWIESWEREDIPRVPFHLLYDLTKKERKQRDGVKMYVPNITMESPIPTSFLINHFVCY